MGCGGSVPDDRSLLKEGQTTLDAQKQLAPQSYELYSQWAPQYAQAGAQNYLQAAQTLYPALAGQINSADDLYRQGLLQSLQSNGQGMYSALQNLNPAQAGLMNTMSAQAQDELNLNGELSARDKYDMAQLARSSGGARGNIMGNSVVFDEMLNNENLQRTRRENARNYASGVAGMENDFYSTPGLALLTASSQAPQLGANAAMQSAYMINADTYNPYMNQYAMDLYNTNYNAQYNAATNSKNNLFGAIGGLMNMGGSIGGAMAGGGGTK